MKHVHQLWIVNVKETWNVEKRALMIVTKILISAVIRLTFRSGGLPMFVMARWRKEISVRPPMIMIAWEAWNAGKKARVVLRISAAKKPMFPVLQMSARLNWILETDAVVTRNARVAPVAAPRRKTMQIKSAAKQASSRPMVVMTTVLICRMVQNVGVMRSVKIDTAKEMQVDCRRERALVRKMLMKVSIGEPRDGFLSVLYPAVSNDSLWT